MIIKLLEGLEWRTSGGFNFDFQKTSDFKPVINQYNWFAGPNDLPERTLDVNGQGMVVTDNNSIYPVGYTQLTYTRTLGQHNFKLLGGTQAEYNKSQSLSGTRNTPFPSNITRELNAGPSGSQANSGTSSEWALESFYGRLNYDYQEKYLLEANARYDASSRFPPGNKWGLFTSVSVGWVATKEKFLENVSWLSNLKLRGSWGILGNQNIGTYPYQDVYNYLTLYNNNNASSPYAYPFSGSTVSPGVAQNSLTDADIKWESTRAFDVGTDITLFNKLLLTIDWYNKMTYNILGQVAIPQYMGLANPTINKGKMKNTGIEASAQYSNNIGEWKYSIGGNIQVNRNILVKYGPPAINAANGTINIEGKPYGSFYMYQLAGIFQSADEISKSPKQQFNPQAGYMKFKDLNGDSVIDANDQAVTPGIYPKFDYSFNAGASWKNFDISVFLYGSYGQKQFVNGWGIQPFDQGSPPTSDWLNAWTPANHSQTMPLLYLTTGTGANSASKNTSTFSTYYLKDASFLRIKNVHVGYNLPAGIAKRIAMNSLRIYFAGDNLVTFTKFPGLDPERVASNPRFVVHPQNKVFSFGVKAIFNYSMLRIMKHIIFFLSLSVLTGLCGCSKNFLTRNPPDQLAAGTFWKTQSDAYLALAGIYSYLIQGYDYTSSTNTGQGWGSGTIYWETLSDNAFSGAFSPTAAGAIEATSGNIQSDAWQTPYRAIETCNKFLDNVIHIPLDADTMNRYIGEVRFIRAYYYFILTQVYGDVVLTLRPLGNDSSGYQLPRTAKAIVTDSIISDLNFAVANLSDSAYSGHAVKGAALGYLAKVYLANQRWQDAATTARTIINSHKFSLYTGSAGYCGLFLKSGAVGAQNNNPEIMFSGRYSIPAAYGPADYLSTYSASFQPLPNLVNDYECTDGLPISQSSLYNTASPYKNRDPPPPGNRIDPGSLV